MSTRLFTRVAAMIFGVVALGHGARLALALPVSIGNVSIPFWVSWLGLLATGALCAWGFRSQP